LIRVPAVLCKEVAKMPDIERITKSGPKRMLAIDAGCIRVLSLGILQRIEALLKEQSSGDDFRLSHYFDYIAGTSTGGIIAAGLSVGMSVDEILKFYTEAGGQMFVKANLLRRLRYKFDSEPLAEMLKGVFGPSTEFGSDAIKTLLLLVMRNATTDSPCGHQQSFRQVQRSGTRRLQSEISTLAARAGQHGRTDISRLR